MKQDLHHFNVAGILIILVATTLSFKLPLESRNFQDVAIPAEGYEIQGYLSQTAGPGSPWVIFAHGNRAEGWHHQLYQTITKNFSPHVNVLAIDLRYFDKSAGDEWDPSEPLLDRSGDIRAAVANLRNRYGVREDQIILIGHSLGAVQVLKAAREAHYRLVISIGPGIIEQLLSDQRVRKGYIDKFEQNTGIRMTNEDLIKEEAAFLPQALFSPCPETPTILAFGELETDKISHYQDRIPVECRSDIPWIIIPKSGHMFGMDRWSLRNPLQIAQSMISVRQLESQLNHQILETLNGD